MTKEQWVCSTIARGGQGAELIEVFFVVGEQLLECLVKPIVVVLGLGSKCSFKV